MVTKLLGSQPESVSEIWSREEVPSKLSVPESQVEVSLEAISGPTKECSMSSYDLFETDVVRGNLQVFVMFWVKADRICVFLNIYL